MPTSNDIITSYAGKTLPAEECDFRKKKFIDAGGNFKEAIFEGFADFTRAVFKGKTVDFSDAVFLAGASFVGAQFGEPYQRIFGEWEIRFSEEDETYVMGMRKVGEFGARELVEVAKKPSLAEQGFLSLLDKWGKADRDAVAKAFKTFIKNPKSVFFARSRFGSVENLGAFDEQKTKKIIEKEKLCIKQIESAEINSKYSKSSDEQEKEERERSLKLFEEKYIQERNTTGSINQSSEVEKTKIIRILARHMDRNELGMKQGREDSGAFFSTAGFYPQDEVSFRDTIFLNNGDVDFFSVYFGNRNNVGFEFSMFGNGKSVVFSGATFDNGEGVRFNSAKFCNGRDVRFSSTTFKNDSNVSFDCTTFSNGMSVSFSKAIFLNAKKLDLSKIIWLNNGDLDLKVKEFGEIRNVRFNECLFLSSGAITFQEARFPEKGSTMFQRCYFGRTTNVDFTGSFFRHTTFEGGTIQWLNDKNKTAKEILEERIGEDKFNELHEKVLAHLVKNKTTPVFEKGVAIFWTDLTTESAKNLTLRRVNLSHSIFDGMTLSHVQLNAPEWLEKDGRRILYESEFTQPNLNNLRNIEDQYTQLKNNFERQGNYLHAGYFHYEEQETRKKILELKGFSFDLLLSRCYKWLSGYGEKPWRAINSALGMILLFSIVLAVMNSEFRGLGELSSLQFAEKGLSKLFGAIIEIVTPFSWKSSKSLLETFTDLHGVKLWRIVLLVLFQIILLGIQLPLLVMAVRRRFKR